MGSVNSSSKSVPNSESGNAQSSTPKHMDVCNHAVVQVSANNGTHGLVVQKGNIMDSDNQLSTGSNFMVIPSNRPTANDKNTLTPGNTQCSMPPNHVDHGKALYFVT